jgi:hypothetical protein
MQTGDIAVRANLQARVSTTQPVGSPVGNDFSTVYVATIREVLRAPTPAPLAVGAEILALAPAAACESPHPGWAGIDAPEQNLMLILRPLAGALVFQIVGMSDEPNR